MIDTHAHLTKRFCDLKKEKLWRNVKTIILAGSDLNDSAENIKLAKDFSKLYAGVGIHPQNFKTDKEIVLLGKLVENNRKEIIAIGETGLDYSSTLTNKDKRNQEKLFRGQIEIALKYDLPLIIHARKAMEEVIEILFSYKKTRGVFHCYAGGKKRIKKVLALGENWYFGIDGNLTYEIGLSEVVAEIPQNRLVLETDCPFLTPVPHRGEKNKPEYVEFTYKKVTEIWDKSFAETEKVIDGNAKRLFTV